MVCLKIVYEKKHKFNNNKMGRKTKKNILKLKNNDLGMIEINRFGIISLTENGRVLFLFLTEVLGFWFASLLITNWDKFQGEDYGITILVFSITLITLLFVSIFFKETIGYEYSEYLKQFGILLFIILVYLVLYYYDKDLFESVYYLNPLKILYTFILVYMLSFYLVQNMIK